MPTIPSAKDQWYVVQVLSGQELKVRDSIERRIAAEEMGDFIYEVLVPQERVSEVRGGQKREASRKFYPGYIIINMHLLHEDNTLVDRTWYFIQETDGVINFAGTKGNPMPYGMPPFAGLLSDNEVAAVVSYIRTAWGNRGSPVSARMHSSRLSRPRAENWNSRPRLIDGMA